MRHEDVHIRGLQVYLVGGAVRDELLGLPSGDRDWVVVGATPQDMAARGFKAVGADFPVFLHPESKEEYALARTERKESKGYKGFSFHTGPDVTLKQDLMRRDLTINALARGLDGQLHDEFGGLADLQAKRLKHVSAAFSEDPVRILRLARFLARLTDFEVDDRTRQLCCAMVEAGEADALVPERVWQEISRGLRAAKPSRMLRFLQDTGTLGRVAPALKLCEQVLRSLDEAARAGLPLPILSALLCLESRDPKALLATLRAPSDCQECARIYQPLRAQLTLWLRSGQPLQAPEVLQLAQSADAFRKPQRFQELLRGWQAETATLPAEADQAARLCLQLERALQSLDGLDLKGIAAQHAQSPARIKAAIEQARLQAIARALAS